MDNEILFEKLNALGLNNRETYMDAAFSRNIGILTGEEQVSLAGKTIGIPGLGGVGDHIL